MSTEWKALAKIGIHHEAMKKSGFQTLWKSFGEMRISQRFSQKVEPALLHGFMVYSLLASAFSLSAHLGNLLSISLAGPKVGSI